MKLIINNPSSDSISYAGGLVVVNAGSSLDVAQGFWKRLYSDTQFLTDLRNSNLIIEDGVSSFRYPASEEHAKNAILSIKFPEIRKDFSFTTSQTNTVLWTPVSGKKYVITDYSLNIRNSTLGAITITIFDETNASGNILYKANFESGVNYDAISNLVTAFVSGAINCSLKITTSGSLIISGTFHGYETE